MQKILESFAEVAAKRLSAVEIQIDRSNQHELNGVARLKEMLGESSRKFQARFVYLGNEESQTVTANSTVTRYDARKNNPKRTEFRLYYTGSIVMDKAEEGDLLVIASLPNDTLLIIIAGHGTTYEQQVIWLFGIDPDIHSRVQVRDISADEIAKLGYAGRIILEEIGINNGETDESNLEEMLSRFNADFPSTHDFSVFAREKVGINTSLDDPDTTLMAWIDKEEQLFRTLENYFVLDQIENGFDNVESFISYSLSVHNRRKSRAGYSLQNHIRQIFIDHKICFTDQATTENNSKPDFLFPSIECYRDASYPVERLTMLGVKSTCKDRWRQVLTEADKIENKHLLTLEPSISENQTNEMRSQGLQLILPYELHSTYRPSQQGFIMSLSQFIGLLYERQESTA